MATRKLPAVERAGWDAPDPEIAECYDRTMDRTLRPYPPGWYCGARWAIDRQKPRDRFETCPRCGRSWMVAHLRLWNLRTAGREMGVRAASLDFLDLMHMEAGGH